MSEAKQSNSREKSKSRPKKAAKHSETGKSKAGDVEEPANPAVEKSISPYPVFDFSEAPASPSPVVEESPPATDWPEPEADSSSDASVRENSKRKRRRKKGKGGQQIAPLAGSEDALTSSKNESPAAAPANAVAPPAPRQSQSKPKLDSEMIAKLAWKIYLAEVSEEGVALIGDNDAKELSRRCFRLAEIFTEEQARRR